MKKFAKLSLVAAVAVAGFTQTACAKDLSEAIKGVNVSGAAVYQYNDDSTDVTGDSVNDVTTTNRTKILVNLSAPVNGDVKFNSTFAAAQNLNTITAADAAPGVSLVKANFAYSGVENLTLIAGKQGLNTPWTCGGHPIYNVQTGTGLLALYNVGPATLAGGYYNQTNLNDATDGVPSIDTKKVDANGDKIYTSLLNGSEDVAVIAAMGNIGPVALDAWYLDMSGDVELDTYTLAANYSGQFDSVKVGAGIRYASLDIDGQNDSTDFIKLMFTAKTGIYSGKIGYATTNDSKADTGAGVIAFDKHTKVAMIGWKTNINGLNNADFIQLGFGADVLPNLNVSLNFNTVDYDQNADQTEYFVEAKYKMSKNFQTLVRLGAGDVKEEDELSEDMTMGRVELLYTF